MADMSLEMLLRTIADMSGINQVQSALGELTNRAGSMGRQLATVGAGLAGLGGAALAGLGAAVKSYGDLEAMQYSVTKNLDLSGEAAERFEQQLQQSDLTVAGTSQSFYEIASAYASAGVAQSELIDLTTTTAQATQALDISTQQAVLTVNEARDSFNLSGQELNSYLQTLNLLANNSSASAQGIAEVASRTSALAGTLGLTSDQVLAMNTVFLEAAPSAEIGASSMNRFISVLGNMPNQSGDAKKALADLGFEANQFSALFSSDAPAAIAKFNEALMNEAPQERLRIMSELFGNSMEYNSVILKAAANQQKLNDYLALTNNEGAKQASWQAETSGAMDLLNSQVAVAQKQFSYMAASIGEALAPIGSAILSALIPAMQGITSFVQNNQQLVVVIAGIAAAATVVGTVLTVIGTAMMALGPIIATIGAGLNGLILVFSFLAATISAPVLLIVAGITAIGVAIYALVANWSTVTAEISALWASVVGAFQLASATISGVLAGIGASMSSFGAMVAARAAQAGAAFSTFGSMVMAAAASAQGALSGFIGFLGGLAGQAYAAAVNIGQSIANGLMAAIGAVQSAGAALAGAVAAVLPGSPVAEGPLTVLNRGYAGGQIAEMVASGINDRRGEVANALSSAFSAGLPGRGDMNVGGINFYGSDPGGNQSNLSGLYDSLMKVQRQRDRKKY